MSTKLYCFEIPGKPCGKARPRFTKSGHTYTPEQTASYENLVKLCFSQKFPNAEPIPKDKSVKAAITAYFPPAKSTPKKQLRLMECGIVMPTKKPDCDNIAKIILDALNGLAYYDDAQIVGLTVEKRYTSPGESPRVKVAIVENISKEWSLDRKEDTRCQAQIP